MTPGFCFQPPTSTLQTKKSTFWRYTWSSGAPTNCWKSKNQWVIGVFQPHKWSYGPAFLAASILLRTTLPRSENLETCQVILLEDLPVKPTLWLMLKGFTVVSMKINKGSVDFRSKILMIHDSMIVFPVLPGFRQIPINSDQRFGHTLPKNNGWNLKMRLWKMRFLCEKHHFQISSRVSSRGSIKTWDANFLATVASEGGPSQSDSSCSGSWSNTHFWSNRGSQSRKTCFWKKVPPNKNTLHNTFTF